MKPRVVEESKRYVKIEILPNVILRLPRNAVKRYAETIVIFRNPISGLTCVAFRSKKNA